MKFEEAVRNTDEIRDAYKPGLQALLEHDRNRLSCNNSRNIRGSVYLDKALAERYPNEPRWDYGIGIQKTSTDDKAIWIEVHPANAREVKVLIAKVHWLKEWLENQAPDLRGITPKGSLYVWIASEGVSLQKTSRQLKLLALAGLSFPCEHYHC